MNKIKILYVDSDSNYGQNLLSYLLKKEYDVKYTTTIKDALIEYSFHKPDILITEINLEDENGLNLLKKVNKLNSNIHTIILTQNAKQELLLEAIKLKVDLFIFKSDSIEDIENKIQKIDIKHNKDKKNQNSNSIGFDLGENYMYKEGFILAPEDRTIKLTSQENSLLKILTSAKGEFVSYDSIQNTLSKKQITSIDTIRTVIRKIRKKTFNDIIQNKSGSGYKVSYYLNTHNSEITSNNVELLNSKILILKGNPKKNELLAYRLNKFGFKCESAFTISQAKEILQYQKFDYIVTDLDLPDGDGIDFIRDLEELLSTKVIVLSSSSDIHYKDYLYFKGILDYIIEVEDISLLAGTIYKTISKVENNTKFNNILIIEQSKKVLKPGGELWVIGNRHLGYHVSLKKFFSKVEVMVSNAKFVIIKASN